MPAGHSGEAGSQARPHRRPSRLYRTPRFPIVTSCHWEGGVVRPPEPKDRPSEVTTPTETMAPEGARHIYAALMRSSFYVDSASRTIATHLEPHCEGIVG